MGAIVITNYVAQVPTAVQVRAPEPRPLLRALPHCLPPIPHYAQALGADSTHQQVAKQRCRLGVVLFQRLPAIEPAQAHVVEIPVNVHGLVVAHEHMHRSPGSGSLLLELKQPIHAPALLISAVENVPDLHDIGRAAAPVSFGVHAVRHPQESNQRTLVPVNVTNGDDAACLRKESLHRSEPQAVSGHACGFNWHVIVVDVTALRPLLEVLRRGALGLCVGCTRRHHQILPANCIAGPAGQDYPAPAQQLRPRNPASHSAHCRGRGHRRQRTQRKRLRRQRAAFVSNDSQRQACKLLRHGAALV